VPPNYAMPKGYKRKHRKNPKRLIAISIIPLMILGLALLWVWKSNMVKEYSAAAKKLETDRGNLVAENMRIRADLLDIKSISQINSVVTKEYGLTQNVSKRIFLSDPVPHEKGDSKINFVGNNDIPDWLETAVMGSGSVRAESEKSPQKGIK
jgi:hypothetical protein